MHESTTPLVRFSSKIFPKGTTLTAESKTSPTDENEEEILRNTTRYQNDVDDDDTIVETTNDTTNSATVIQIAMKGLFTHFHVLRLLQLLTINYLV